MPRCPSQTLLPLPPCHYYPPVLRQLQPQPNLVLLAVSALPPQKQQLVRLPEMERPPTRSRFSSRAGSWPRCAFAASLGWVSRVLDADEKATTGGAGPGSGICQCSTPEQEWNDGRTGRAVICRGSCKRASQFRGARRARRVTSWLFVITVDGRDIYHVNSPVAFPLLFHVNH